MLLQPTDGEMLVAYEGDYQPFCYESESETNKVYGGTSCSVVCAFLSYVLEFETLAHLWTLGIQ